MVYTLWLKRSTPQNIVIGGLAGALPPVIGWAAASGTAPLNAWLLCAIIFLWTPPHFWALSLYTSEDYAKAGVPMMPVVRGAASTRRQILAYSLILVPPGDRARRSPASAAPLYLAVAGLGGAVFIVLAARLARSGAGDGAGRRKRSLRRQGRRQGRAQPVRLLDPLSVLPVRRPAGRASGGRRAAARPMSDPFDEERRAQPRRARRRSIAIAARRSAPS